MSSKHSILGSFGYAYNGVREAFISEPNFRIHSLSAIAAFILAFLLKLSIVEWVILIFTVAFVLILELLNTAIEKIVDIISPDFHPKAKVAKDVSAAAVFISSVLAVVVGIFLFIPKLL